MTDLDQKQLGKTLWNTADMLRGAMNADDFRDHMLSFLSLRYLSDNYEFPDPSERIAVLRDIPLKAGAGVDSCDMDLPRGRIRPNVV